MFTRVLVPLDGSPLSEGALQHAAELAKDGSAELILLHILERNAPAEVHGGPHLTRTADAEGYLDGVAARLESQGITVSWHAHPAPEGDVAASIVAHASEEGIDLIVMCTHGQGDVRQRMFGTIAQQVLQRGSTPVFLAPPSGTAEPRTVAELSVANPGNGQRDATVSATWAGGEASPPPSRGRILVPLDATASAERAVDAAAVVARRLNCSIHLVMVVPTSGTIRGKRLAAATLLPAATRETLNLEEQQANQYLERIAERVRGEGQEATVAVRRGDPMAELADESLEPEVTAVVVATHGRAGLQAIWSGSVAARLLKRTHKPILLLRAVDSEE